MHRDLDLVDALGVGAFLQTFMLALTARGVGSCVQVSIAGYPDVIREQLGISEEMRILCGVSIGYALGAVFGGDFAALIAQALIDATGWSPSVGLYIIALSAISLIALATVREPQGAALGAEAEVAASNTAASVPARS
jgi:hypothetical protein